MFWFAVVYRYKLHTDRQNLVPPLLPREEVAGYEWTDHTGRITHVGKAPPAKGAYNITPLRREPRSPRPARVLVEVSGGVVQGIFADEGQPVDVIVADYDTDGCIAGENGVALIDEGTSDECLVTLNRPVIDVDPERVARMFALEQEEPETAQESAAGHAQERIG